MLRVLRGLLNVKIRIQLHDKSFNEYVPHRNDEKPGFTDS